MRRNVYSRTDTTQDPQQKKNRIIIKELYGQCNLKVVLCSDIVKKVVIATYHPIPFRAQSLKNVHAKEHWYEQGRANWVREG